jgi:hypothetical protein
LIEGSRTVPSRADATWDNIPGRQQQMRKLFVLGILAVLVSSAAATVAGAAGHSDGRSCGRQRFVAIVETVSADSVTLHKLAGDGKGVSVTYRLLDQTQIRLHDQPASRTALAAGQRVVADARTCQGAGRPTETRLVTIILIGKPDGAAKQPPAVTEPSTEEHSKGTTPPTQTTEEHSTGTAPPTQTTPEVTCAQGDFTAPLGAVSAGSISFTSNGAEGLKTFSVSVTGETAITKNDVAVGLTALAPGDRLHVWVVRCQATPPTLRATRIVDLGPATTV